MVQGFSHGCDVVSATLRVPGFGFLVIDYQECLKTKPSYTFIYPQKTFVFKTSAQIRNNPCHPCSIFLSATDARMMYTGNQHSCIRGKKHLRLKTKPSKPPQPPKLFSLPRVGFGFFHCILAPQNHDHDWYIRHTITAALRFRAFLLRVVFVLLPPLNDGHTTFHHSNSLKPAFP
jgi:hypothetical protein